jgi:hypothetical protein
MFTAIAAIIGSIAGNVLAAAAQRTSVASNVNSLVNCGSGAVTSLGTTLITNNVDTTLPGGCFSFITTSTIVTRK